MTAEILNILKYQNRGMIMKKKLKGFTLLELVIVMAIFSVIAVGAMAMIRPAMQLFNKTASQEGASADIDNISRYIQDNLKYADRVNVYHGYDLTGVSGDKMVDKMLNTEITDILPVLTYNESTNTYEKTYTNAKPLEFFSKYYYDDSAECDGKKVNVMEIANDGFVTIYTYKFEYKSNGSVSNNFIESTSINREFYDDYIFSIDDDGWDLTPPNMTIKMNIEYSGVTKEDDGKIRKLNQEKKIGLTFFNINQRSTMAVKEGYSEDSITDQWGNKDLSKEGSVCSASAYKNFSIDEKNPDGTDNDDFFKNGNTYIIYTVPEIIIP